MSQALKDFTERVGWTFVEGYTGAWIIDGADLEALFAVDHLQFAAATALIAAAKVVLAFAQSRAKGEPNPDGALPTVR